MGDLSRRHLFGLFAAMGVAAAIPADLAGAPDEPAKDGYVMVGEKHAFQWGQWCSADNRADVVFPLAFLSRPYFTNVTGPNMFMAQTTAGLIASLADIDEGYWIAFGQVAP